MRAVHFICMLSFGLICLGLSLSSLEVFAQSPNLSPRVLVIFDTSGSMLWEYTGARDCRGDGSVDFPHRNGCDMQAGSRLYHAKTALSEVIDNSSEVEFGLMRYGQLEPGDPDFGTLQNQVGAQYQDAAGLILSTNYDGSTNGCGFADLLVSPNFSSSEEVLTWMDGVENYPVNKELRANGYTPLTQSLSSARAAMATLISQDPESECRSHYVLLLTDGYQQCPGQDANDPDTRMMVSNQLVQEANTLRSLSIEGFDYDVRTFVVGFGPGTSFATELDVLAREGGTAVDMNGQFDFINGNAYQANDPDALAQALQAAIDNASPRERCDGIDNDCDGEVDEDFLTLGEICRVGIGECNTEGIVQCALDGDHVECSVEPLAPQVERCDEVDNDCDGRLDEGTMNQCGNCGGNQNEVCDGVDNDCDGATDEGLLNACETCGDLPIEVCNNNDDDCDGRIDEGTLNDCGTCGQLPIEVCDCNDNDCDNRIDESLQCDVCNCTPSEEVCDEMDNDCDGLIDEGTLNVCNQCGAPFLEICNGLDEDCDGFVDEEIPNLGGGCGINTGECVEGILSCVNGAIICQGEVEALSEICDGLDNDCDGVIEEGATNACNQCGPSMIEVCDNIDNDCDGEDDTPDLCDEGLICLNGECTSPCMQGECIGNLMCINGVCSTPCRNRDCPSGWVCQNGTCADPCVGISCLTGNYCTLGRCIEADCYGAGCPQGLMCREGSCVEDPCATANCGPNQGCVNGQCFDDCDDISCQEGTTCVNGSCVDDPCLRVTCGHTFYCVEGQCIQDPCFEVECNTGFMCENGDCIEDPCNQITCPVGDLCHRGVCRSMNPTNTNPNQPSEMDPVEPIDGVPNQTPEGCDCDQKSQGLVGSLPLWLLLWLPFGISVRRARKLSS